ncbi:MAG: Zinc transporter substrate-binding protein [Euryarchaeota archaeon]|nr:Zinc transporter substrate-binding protein [Euryarchaeota archaeon]
MISNLNKFLIFLTLLAMAAISGCISQDQPQSSAHLDNASGNASDDAQENAIDKINVATTIAPLAEFVRAVGGDRVAVTVVVPPGAEPHTFEPTPSLMVDMSKADLYVMNGAGLEFWIDRLLQANKDMTVIDSSKGIDLISESEDEMDPHIWISLNNAAVQVQNICSGLIQVDPANKDYYSQNRDSYLEQLKALDEELNSSFAASKKKIFVVHHPAWTYFARDYALEQVPLMENEKEPGPKYLSQVIDLARQNNITTVFIEPEFNPKSAEVIAREMNASITTLDPLAADYLNNMRYAGRAIASSLN